jgi:hypothetical protein
MQAMSRLGGISCAIILGLAGCAACGAEAPDATLDAALSGALAPIADAASALARGGPARIAVMPVAGAGGADLGRFITERATARLEALVGVGVSALDRGWADELASCRKEGSAPLTPELLATCLGCQAACAGSVVDLGDRYALTLRLVSAETGTDLARTTATLAKAEADALRFTPPESAGGARLRAPTLAPGAERLSIDRALVVRRRGEGGRFARPEVWDGRPLAIGDQIQVWVRPRQRCRLQVIVFNSDGTVERLFPAGAAPSLVDGAKPIGLPPSENHSEWYPLEGPEGADRFVVIAESESAGGRPGSLIDEFSSRLAGEGGGAAKDEPAAPAPQPASGGGAPPAAAPAQPEKGGAPATPPPGERKTASSARARMWERFKEERGAADAAAQVENRFYDSATLLASGASLTSAEVRTLGKPKKGEPVEVAWKDGEGVAKQPIATLRLSGSGRIIDQFEITYK